VLFAAVPGVQPVTVIAIVAGASLGMRAGVATGALAAFVSNLFLGQGIWTPQQMLGWGACGAVGALLGPALRSRWVLAAVSAVLGFAFSMMMDVWLWYGFAPHTLPALVAVLGRGLWFDASHAAGNVVIALAAGPELRRMLDRYGSRLRTVVVWA
jgi:energy-coupling factor transport system substrate-specific component